MTPLTRSRNRARFFGAGGAGGTWLTTGPTLDLAFAGVPLDLNNPNGDSIDLEFIPQNYQVATQYSIREPGMALVSKNFSDIITFTRASSATYFDATGTLQTAATDQPRFDYDPSTLAARGLLIEEARTNLQTYSAEFGTASGLAYGLTQANGTVTLNDAVAPDGTTTATSWIEDLTTSGRYISSVNFTPSLNTYYTVSVFVKIASGSRYFGILFPTGAGWAGATQPAAVFELSGSGTVTFTSGSPGFISASIQPVGNGWYRCATTALSDPTSTTAARIQLRLSNSSTSVAPNYAGDGTSGLYLWGAQLEAGAFPTSYIPTVASTVTRAVDVAQVNTVSPWYNAAEGTLCAEVMLPSLPTTGTFPNFVSINDGGPNEVLALGSNGVADRQVVVRAGGAPLWGTNAGGALTVNVASKWALGAKSGDYGSAYDGVAGSTSSAVGFPTGITQMQLGRRGLSNQSTLWLRRVTYYPRRLSNAELQAITA